MRKRKIEWLGRSRVSEGAATPQPAGERALRGNGAGGSGGGGEANFARAIAFDIPKSGSLSAKE